MMLYGAFCILEDISYTRKDGQYLRWDSRSGRSKGKNQFNKGEIFSFEDAIYKKLQQFASDLNVSETQLNLFSENFALNLLSEKSQPNIQQGSCLEILPTLAASSINFVMTSPPYANRYDYTRTYALELAFLGCSEEKVKNLRQAMLSCTVENRDKNNYLEEVYIGIGRKEDFLKIDLTFNNQAALHEVLNILEIYKQQDKLNNSNITRMVRNYFYEMSFVIYELSRVLKPGGIVAMVNDNVRYAGEEVPVDLILSNIAESFGLETRYIWTLERGKGNSSQQMGNHGRSELRKMCIYLGKATTVTEANRINYRLRSTFLSQLEEYKTLFLKDKIDALLPVKHLYSWESRVKLSIGEDAFNYINQHPNLELIQVFCHPKLIREHPILLAYYRNISALSQKAVQYFAKNQC
ncbi:MAG: hypothetical protein HC908_18110 [Calothrix sp. SM1_7_51]|nr:hypothetical protein [Calothrix sp. SM1_7_51]